MTRDVFLQELRIALQGNISQAKVNEHLRYYENYIMEESRKGLNEEQVIESLGNPRLIAKTIIEVTDKENSDEKTDKNAQTKNFKKKSWNSYAFIWIIIAIVILVLVLIARVVLVLIPIIIPVILVGVFLYLLFYGNRK